MASRGHLGGLAWADAAGAADPGRGRASTSILIETVGVGQAEVEIASLADTHPGRRRAGHGRLDPGGQGRHPGDRRHLRGEQERPARRPGGGPGPAHHAGDGGLRPGGLEAADRLHHGRRRGEASTTSWPPWTGTPTGWPSRASGDRRRRARAREEISAIAVAELRQRLGGLPGESRLDDLAGQVAAGKLDPYAAADELIVPASPPAPRIAAGSHPAAGLATLRLAASRLAANWPFAARWCSSMIVTVWPQRTAASRS